MNLKWYDYVVLGFFAVPLFAEIVMIRVAEIVEVWHKMQLRLSGARELALRERAEEEKVDL